MNLNIHNVFAILIALACSQCIGNEANEYCEDTHEVINIDASYQSRQIDLSLEGKPYNFKVYDVFDTDESTILFYYTADEHTIQVVDLNKNIFLPAILLVKEGTNKIQDVDDITVYNRDSIFVFSEQQQHVYLINGQGEILQKIDFSKILENETIPTYVVNDSPESKITYWSDRKLLILQITYELSDLFYTPELYKYPFIGMYNLEDKKIEKIGQYPNNYQAKQTAFEDYYPITTDFKNNLVTSYGVSHFIGVTDITNKSTEFYCAKSVFLSSSFNLLPYDAPFPKRNELYRSSGFYTKILYDKYKDCYYRIVKHSQDNKNADNKLSQYLQSRWSILVLSSQFNVLKEAVFDDKIYDFDVIDVTRNGLLISRENPFSLSNNEEVLSFDLINI